MNPVPSRNAFETDEGAQNSKQLRKKHRQTAAEEKFGEDSLISDAGRYDMNPSPNRNAFDSDVEAQGSKQWRKKPQQMTVAANLAQFATISEAARLEMSSQPSKTPVSLLQELLIRRGMTPKYELVQTEGQVHDPTFSYRVSVDNEAALGSGRSKKEAKHVAAKAILEKLIRQDQREGISNSACSNALQEVASQVVSPYENTIPGNPIGTLQEMCMSRRWPPPSYVMEGAEGLPHERRFTIACTIYNHREVGTGKSKKLAKRQAAFKMWEKLRGSPEDTNNVRMGYNEEDGEENRSLNSVDFNYVQFLQEIASEQEIEVTYVDVEERSVTGKVQCLVQLSTLPVAVCYGCGATSKDAQAAAAHSTLEYLKILTKG